ALSTQSTSSKSSLSALLGVSRECARPGEHTSTLRSCPTSECTPNVVAAAAMTNSLDDREDYRVMPPVTSPATPATGPTMATPKMIHSGVVKSDLPCSRRVQM